MTNRMTEFQTQILDIVNRVPKAGVQIFAPSSPDLFSLHIGPAAELSWSHSVAPKVITITLGQYREIVDLAESGFLHLSDIAQPYPGGTRRLVFLNSTPEGRAELATLQLEQKVAATV